MYSNELAMRRALTVKIYTQQPNPPKNILNFTFKVLHYPYKHKITFIMGVILCIWHVKVSPFTTQMTLMGLLLHLPITFFHINVKQ